MTAPTAWTAITPLPWKREGLQLKVHGRGTVARAVLPSDGGCVEAVGNAAYIDLACNSYPAMWDALVEARATLVSVADGADSVARLSINSAIAQIEAALRPLIATDTDTGSAKP